MRYTDLVNKATAAFLAGGISQAKVDAFFARHGPHLQALIAAKNAKKADKADTTRPQVDMKSRGLAISTPIKEIVASRNAALVSMREAMELLADAIRAGERSSAHAEAAHHGRWPSGVQERGTKAQDAIHITAPNIDKELEAYRRILDARAWTYLRDATGLTTLMDATAREAFDRALLADPPVLTEDAAQEAFRQYLDNAGEIFGRGLAMTLSKLDARFKSHDVFNFKSRVVLTHVFDSSGHWSYSSRRGDIIDDVERAIAVVMGVEQDPGALRRAINASRGNSWGPRAAVAETKFLKVRTFMNGNAHLWFASKDIVNRLNRALADYYGAVLPDAVTGNKPTKPGTDLARDLQFYPTPPDVVAALMATVHINRGDRALEPSAGEGVIVRALARAGAKVDAVEVHAGRAAKIQNAAPGVRVLVGNFLAMPLDAVYDVVVMNPPFYGTHWMDHVRRAFDLLAPRGTLATVLPATAEVAETPDHEAFRAWAKEHGAQWRDLPTASFAASGTRISTVILTLRRKRV